MKLLSKFSNTITPSIFTLVGIFLYFEAKKIRTLRFGGALGGDFFPKLLSVMLIVLSIIWLFKEFIISIKRKGDKKLDIKGGIKSISRVILFTFIFVLYIVSLKYLGFTISTVFLMFFNHLLLREEINLKIIPITLIYSIIVTFGVWYLFEKVFEMTLPTGLF